MTAYNGQVIAYDAIGNPLNYRDGMVFAWQNGRELASLQQGDFGVSYTYYALRRRPADEQIDLGERRFCGVEFTSYPLADYIDTTDKNIEFPEEICITYAVYSNACGNTEFIVDGSSQVCQHCGKLLFRTETKKYRLTEN